MKANLNRASRMAGPALLSLGLLAGLATAGPGGIGFNSPGGDDVGSMPDGAPPDDPSLLLVGTLADLNAVILSVQGAGEITVEPLWRGSDRMVAELEGSLHVTLAPELLASGRVVAFFAVGTTFAGGTADVLLQGTWSHVADLPALAVRQLPFAALANETSPTIIQADAFHDETYTLVSKPVGETVVVRQAVR